MVVTENNIKLTPIDIYVMMGLPGSGKTTFAEAMAEKNDKIVIISRDDIRYILSHSYKYNKDKRHQSLVKKTSNDMIFSAISFNFDVVLDQLSLTKKQRKKTIKDIRHVAKSLHKEVRIHLVYCTESEENVSRRMQSDMRWGDEDYYRKTIENMKSRIEIDSLNKEDFDRIIFVDKNGTAYKEWSNNSRVWEKRVNINIQSADRIIIAEKKKKKIKVFLDIDGCISNWVKGVCQACDIDLEDKDIRQTIKEKDGYLDDYVGETTLWNSIEKGGVDFWENLELFPWSKKLYKALEEIADEFSILSSPGKFTATACTACHGKVIWLDNHFNNKENYLFGYNKSLCASDNAILVDDRKHKIDSFIKAGGHGFVWPNPLSLLDGDIDVDNTIDELLEYIKGMKNDR